jgi:hypothetical protein
MLAFLAGRCDAKCYSATDPHCDGLQRALANTAALVDPSGELSERMLAMGGDQVEVLPELPLEPAG